MDPIYLDYNATTPVDPAALAVLHHAAQEFWGNPSSTHSFGQAAQTAVQQAREQVATLLGADCEEIVFTSGGSEANNHALKGVVFGRLRGLARWWKKDAHLITTAVEHPATLNPCAFLKRMGCAVTILPVDRFGRVDPDAIRRAVTRQTVLISVMHSNNEVGTLQPIKEIATIARERGILLHTDAAQSIGKLPVNVRDLGVDLLSVAGHKVYAPKGVGVLFVRRGVQLEPLIHGAGHEAGRRAGTENVPYMAALGQACATAGELLPDAAGRQRALRDRLHERLRLSLGERLVLNGHPEQRLPNTLNVNFVGHVGAEFLAKVPEVAASTGSACHEGHVCLSPVLQAMGVRPEIGRGAIRLTVGRFTTEADVDHAADALIRHAKS